MPDERELAEGQMTGTLDSGIISTKQGEIAELAGRDPKLVLTSLAHRIDMAWMREAYRRTRKDGAVGVDAVDRKTFEANLDDNLASLLEGLKSGRYRAPPVRRVHIEKDGGKATRPIGIPTLGDKVLQRAVVMALEPVYEQDFSGLLVRLPPRTLGARRAATTLAGHDERRRWLDHRSGHPRVLRQRGQDAAGGDARRPGAGRSDPSRGREVVERGGHGGRCGESPDEGHAAGRGDQSAAGQHLPARGARHLVRGGRTTPSSARRLHGALCRRRGPVLRERGRRPTGDGGAAEKARALRPRAERAEDAAGAVHSADVG